MIRLGIILGVAVALAVIYFRAGEDATPTLNMTSNIKPLQVAITRDGVLSFTAMPDKGLVFVDDLLNGKELAEVAACDRPRGGELTEDEVSFIVVCEPLSKSRIINTASFEAADPFRQVFPPSPSRDIGKKNQVVMLGMIHDGFRTSERYSLEVLRQTIRAIEPDFVLVEIPPNRMGAAIRGFRKTGELTEPRAGVFPEYTDVVFPLTREMDFDIIGVAAWSRPMNEYRRAARRRLRSDPAMAHAWSDKEEAEDEFEEAIEGRAYDPEFIHSDEFDKITRRAFAPDIEYFNNALGPGGWKNINEAHYRLIAEALDRHKGAGKRILITFGASHKYWFLEELRKREDIILLDPLAFIPEAD